MEITQERSNLMMPVGFIPMDNEEMSYCEGGAAVDYKWWGVKLTLSSTETNELIAASGASFAVAVALCSFIPDPTLTKIMATGIAVGGAIFCGRLAYCNAAGRGVYMNIPWTTLHTGIYGYALLIGLMKSR